MSLLPPTMTRLWLQVTEESKDMTGAARDASRSQMLEKVFKEDKVGNGK